jgi:TFIIH basal transcription factor complex TTD-A subunit
MVQTIKGILVTCEPAIKQFILHLEAKHELNVGLKELDDTHILICSQDTKIIETIEQKIEELRQSNTYHMEKEKRDNLFRIDYLSVL